MSFMSFKKGRMLKSNLLHVASMIIALAFRSPLCNKGLRIIQNGLCYALHTRSASEDPFLGVLNYYSYHSAYSTPLQSRYIINTKVLIRYIQCLTSSPANFA